MKNHINKFFIAAVLVAFVLTSCTDEEEIIKGSTKTNPKTNKVLVTEKQPYEICQYPEYDDNDYDETTMMHFIEDFDRLMRTGESEVQTYDLTKSVAVLELYYNYAVVDKQTEYDESIEYDPQIFEFTVPLYEGQVNVTELKDAYHEFLNDVLQTMGNRYLMYSNIYVETKTETSVTFGLKTMPYVIDLVLKPFRFKVLRPYTEISIPNGLISDWNFKPQLWGDYTMGNLAVKKPDYFGIAIGFMDLNNKNVLPPTKVSALLGTFNTTQFNSGLEFRQDNGTLDNAVGWTIAQCNSLWNYDQDISAYHYAGYSICGVVPARRNQDNNISAQKVDICLSSINICKIRQWFSLKAFLDTISFN